MYKSFTYKEIQIGNFVYVMYDGIVYPALVIGKRVKREEVLLAFLKYCNKFEARFAVPLDLSSVLRRLTIHNDDHFIFLNTHTQLRHLKELNTYGTINLKASVIIDKFSFKEKYTYINDIRYN